jgi:ankyrin repeat protein
VKSIEANRGTGSQPSSSRTFNLHPCRSLFSACFDVTAAHRHTYDLSLRAAILGTVTSSKPNSLQLDLLSAMIPSDLVPQSLASKSTSNIIAMADTQCLAILAVYLLSNALVEPKSEPASRFLQWMQNQKDRDLARLLLLPKGSTQAAALENIFWYALISQDDIIMRKLPTEIYRHLLYTSHPWLDSHIISLIDSDNGFNYRSYGPLSPFEYVCFLQHIGLAQLFLDAGAEPVQLTTPKILRAMEYRKLTELKRQNRSRKEGRFQFDVTLARLLISRGMSLCHSSVTFDYPIVEWQASLPAFACHFNDVALMETLLGENPVHRPCVNCLIIAVQQLRSHNPESRRMIQVLNDAGIDVPVPIILRCDDDDFSLLRKLLDSGVKIKPSQLRESYFVDFGFKNLSSLSTLLGIILHSQRHLKQFPSAASTETSISLSHVIKSLGSREKTHSGAIQAKTLISQILSLREDLRASYLSQALTMAVKEANEHYIYALIDAGARVSSNHVMESIKTCTLQIIVSLSQSIGSPDLSQLGYYTYAAILRGDVELLHSLLTTGLLSDHCTTKDGFGANSVAISIHHRHFEIASSLIHNDDLLNETLYPRTGNYFSHVTPLEAAIQADRLDLVDNLLAKGAGVNDDRALRAAVPVSYSILRQLLAISISGSVSRTKNFGIPALHLAIVLGQMQAMELLLRNDVKVHMQYENFTHRPGYGSKFWRPSEPCSQKFQPDSTIFETAVIVDRSPGLFVLRSVLNVWRRSGKPPIGPISSRTSPLLLAIKHSNHHAVDLFLEENSQDLNSMKELGYPRTPLQCAAENGNLKLVKRLIAMGANVNEPPAKRVGVTSLQIASRKGFFGIVEALLEAGADPNLPGPMPWLRTPLEEAAQEGRLDIISLFMAQKNLPGDQQVENANRLATKAKFTAAAELVDSLYQERLARLSSQQPAGEDGTVESVDKRAIGADQNLFSAFNGFDDMAPGLVMTETEFSNGNDFMVVDAWAPWELYSGEIARLNDSLSIFP